MVAAKFADQLKALPDKPGVYLMKSAAGEVIYVGKAVNLKNQEELGRAVFRPALLFLKTGRSHVGQEHHRQASGGR